MGTLTFLDGAVVIHAAGGGSSVISNFQRMVCPSCNQPGCVFSCDGSQGADENNGEDESDVAERVAYNGALDGVEALLIALVVTGVIAESEDTRVNEAIQTSLDAFENRICG